MSVSTLARHPTLIGLSEPALAAVAAQGEFVSLATGDVVIREGESNRYVFLVIDGHLEATLADRSDRPSELSLASRHGGDSVGEYSFIDDAPASATVVARVPTDVFRIRHDKLSQLLGHDPDLERVLYRNLLRTLVSRLRASDAELDLFRLF